MIVYDHISNLNRKQSIQWSHTVLGKDAPTEPPFLVIFRNPAWYAAMIHDVANIPKPPTRTKFLLEV